MKSTEFISIEASDRVTLLAQAIMAREAEILSYEVNIATYEAMLADQTITKELRDATNATLASEHREREKSLRIYLALKSQIPGTDLVDAIAAEKAKAAKAKT